ncbi:hypothetical protein [Tengunoibacter tsumagoiensis]|uniref:Uncharacterized protein n=1 Tax=Tengunoibacter tsumagoiensis TaxID=2014871 RepID=A0A401ZVX5_9CHLR|nr:hypothetical protein [Tengunoibacter tsumagoiensis]GCE10920.1 hypothetical protein KTT_07790 [Tengunoibacter tsumagoiensis]
MNINEQFESFLAELGVEMERPDERDEEPEISIFQASRDHYGVFYRLDILNHRPELRIMLPIDKGAAKMDIYLVRLSELTPLNQCFVSLSHYEGSAAYEHSRDATFQHLLYAVAEMMKQLFWAGDLQRLIFPAEIQVTPVLIHDERKKGL